MTLSTAPLQQKASREQALASLMERIKERKKLELVPSTVAPIQNPKENSTITISPSSAEEPSYLHTGIGRTGEVITFNAQQTKFIKLASSGNSCVLLGAAGTGKTTCQQGAIQALIQSGIAGTLKADGHKYLPAGEVPGIVVIAFTRRAVNNIRRFMSADMTANCLTHHKLLEYEPEYYEIFDEITGKNKKTMRFEATRNILRSLPTSVHTVIIEESSMYSLEMFQELMQACPHSPQIIFLGDINQLPPVFGSAILGYKMLELPVVELTEVYRQALDSPIISLAHRVLSGVVIKKEELPQYCIPNKLYIHPYSKKTKWEVGLFTATNLLLMSEEKRAAITKLPKQLLEAFSTYNPKEDIILCPFNKSFGTVELNKHVAQHLATTEGKVVYEVIAGYEKHYFSVGDRVLYDKEEATIVGIVHNNAYNGKRAATESPHLNYWGQYSKSSSAEEHYRPMSAEEEEALLDRMMNSVVVGEEDRVTVASHCLQLRMADTEQIITVESAAAINEILLGYALTVHKAQGSEWKRVFLLLHQSHAIMLSRELLYTAITRAKEELYILCEAETFIAGIQNQRIKGNTLEEKAEYFKGKIEKMER